MRINYFGFCLSILSIMLLLTCSPTTKTKTVKLSGIIKNAKSENARISSNYNNSVNLGALINDSIFQFEFEIDSAQWFKLTFDKDKCKSYLVSTEIYLEPGDNIEITADANDFYKTLSAKGKGAEENNFLFSKFNIYYPNCTGWPPSASLGVKEYLAELNKMKTDLSQSLKQKNKQNKMNQHFVDYEKRAAKYRWAYTKCTYPSFHKGNKGEYPDNLPTDFYDFLHEVNYDDEEMYLLGKGSKYGYLVHWYFDRMAQKKKTGIEGVKEQFKTIDNKITSQKIKNSLMYSILYPSIKKYGASQLQELIAKFNNETTNDNNKLAIQNLLKE